MFSGIILTTARLKSIQRTGEAKISVQIEDDLQLTRGDSVAVNGVCLTLTGQQKNLFLFDLAPETVEKTTFKTLKNGALLNIELPVTLQTFLSGHLVSGHVDGTAKVCTIKKENRGAVICFRYQNRDWDKFIVQKGSITVNGISLTVAEKDSQCFWVAIIPHTLNSTNLKELKANDQVNIELDLIGKYIYNFLSENKK